MLALVRWTSALRRRARWVRAWLFPTEGWADVVREYAAGRRSWPVPGRPDARPTMPWPCAWTLVRVVPPGEDDARAFGFLEDERVSVSGLVARWTELGARCARCGSPLHQADLALQEPPACALCVSAVERAVRRAR